MSARFTTFDPDSLPGEAKVVHDRILRDRGYLPAPYRFWLASPGFADRIEPVADFLRHGVALEARQVELVVPGLLGLYTSVCLTMAAYRVPAKNDEPNLPP